jgi:hypothetical protein
MSMRQDREAIGDERLVLYHTDVDGRFVRVFLPVLFGVFAAGGLWLLFLWVTALPTATAHVVVVGLVLCPGTLLFSWLSVRLTAAAWRSGRGDWWLRLSSKGFEVNDRTFTPRRYEWREIDKFMLVAPSAQVDRAAVAPAKTFAQALKDGGAQSPAFRVGFRCSPGHRRSPATRLFSDVRGRDGTKADGLIIGYWDRPFDEAVDLMNEWLTRYNTA